MKLLVVVDKLLTGFDAPPCTWLYATMSAQLQEIIERRKAQAMEYEEYLERIAELAQRVAAGQPQDTPAALDTPGKRALYNNLKPASRRPAAATTIDEEPEVYVASGSAALDRTQDR